MKNRLLTTASALALIANGAFAQSVDGSAFSSPFTQQHIQSQVPLTQNLAQYKAAVLRLARQQGRTLPPGFIEGLKAEITPTDLQAIKALVNQRSVMGTHPGMGTEYSESIGRYIQDNPQHAFHVDRELRDIITLAQRTRMASQAPHALATMYNTLMPPPLLPLAPRIQTSSEVSFLLPKAQTRIALPVAGAAGTSGSVGAASVVAGTSGQIVIGGLVAAGLTGAALAAGSGRGGTNEDVNGAAAAASNTFLDSGAGLTYNATTAATFAARQEYKNVAQYGSASTINPYTLLGVDDAYGHGLSGSGKTIAIHDSHFYSAATHIDMAGKVITTFGTLNEGSGAFPYYHGASVSGFAAGRYNSNSATFVDDNSAGDYSGGATPLWDYGIMGVAYNASLHLADTSNIYSPAQWALSTDDARIKGAIVQNNSWGFDDDLNPDTVRTYMTNNTKTLAEALVFYQTQDQDVDGTKDVGLTAGDPGWTAANWNAYITALNNFQVNGVIVFALSNTSALTHADTTAALPYLDATLAEAWITVGNIETSGATVTGGSVTRKSAPCAQTAAYCVVADGWNVTSLNGGTTYAYLTGSGTSFAAPQVSGLVALLSEAFPTHTPAQLVDRLLASADNSFFTASGTTTFANGITHGYNSNYGHGIPDLYAALQPITTSKMSRSILVDVSSGGGGGGGGYKTATAVPIAITRMTPGAAFGDSIARALDGKTAYFHDALYGGFAFDFGKLVSAQPLSDNTEQRLANHLSPVRLNPVLASPALSFITLDVEPKDGEGIPALLSFGAGEGRQIFMGQNYPLEHALGLTEGGGQMETKISNNEIGYSVPFVAAARSGYSVGNNLTLTNRLSWSSAAFVGDDDKSGAGVSGMASALKWQHEGATLAAFMGVSLENGAFIGTSTDGAFGEAPSAPTVFYGTSYSSRLNESWHLGLLGAVGATDVSAGDTSLIKFTEPILTSSFGGTLSTNGVLDNMDSFSLSIAQPHRVESGRATISIPQRISLDGLLQFAEENVSFSPTGRQIDLSARYNFPLSFGGTASLEGVVSREPGHVRSASMEKSVIGSYQLAF